MLELLGGAAPQNAPVQGSHAAPTAVGLDNRVEAGLDFAQMLRQAEKDQAPPAPADDEVEAAPEHQGREAETAVAQEEEREEAPVAEGQEEGEEEEVDPDPTHAAAAAAAVAPELTGSGDSEGGEEGEGEGESEGEGAFAALTSARADASSGEEELPLETDAGSEGDEGGVPMAQAPAAEAGAGNPLELLNFSELMDPDLVVEKTPDQLVARISQAAASAAAPQLQEELAETVMPQVIRSLATLVREGGAEMRLQLKPVDLGEIELRVRTAEGVVRGEMMVQHPEVKQLLDDQVDRLKSALAAQGLELEGFDVNVDRDPRFAQAGEQEQRDGGRQRAGVPAAEAAPAPVAVSVGDHAVDFTT